MTTNNVVSDQHSVVIQNTANGQVDFLRFNGSTLQASVLRDYGLSGWTVIGNGDLNGDNLPDLVAQNNSTGQLDFLFLNATGNLTSSALSNVPVPHAVGLGVFNSGPAVVTQLANGQLDVLSFNYTAGTLVASDLIAGTVGLPHAVGVGESFTSWPVFANVGAAGNDTVLVQYADGTISALGFSGSLATGLTFTNSFSRGPLSDTLFALDQDNDFAHQRNANVVSVVDGVTGRPSTRSASVRRGRSISSPGSQDTATCRTRALPSGRYTPTSPCRPAGRSSMPASSTMSRSCRWLEVRAVDFA